MFHTRVQAFISLTRILLRQLRRGCLSWHALLLLSAILATSSIQFSFYLHKADAAELKAHSSCTRYTIHNGDTLNAIASKEHLDVLTLARTNSIANIDLIFAGRSLCIPQKTGHSPGKTSPGILSNGSVRWYAYDALAKSTFHQVDTLLHYAAIFYDLPTNLVLAIARQESNFQQHVISKDGGIGVMQIMPDTATWINTMMGTKHDPYKLRDNIFMGAFYVHMLCNTFHGNIVQVISAYNEGPGTVTQRGIMNWNYVNNVLAALGHFPLLSNSR